MAIAPRFRSYVSDIGESVTKTLGLSLDEYYGFVVSSPRSIFITSSTPGYGVLTVNSKSEPYTIQNNPLIKEAITVSSGVPEEQKTAIQTAENMSTKIEWIEIQLTPDDVVVVRGSEVENLLHNTGSNTQQSSYDELASFETDLRVKELAYLLTLEPIEDGYFHPAEKLVEESLKASKFDPHHWAYAAYLRNIDTEPTLAAAVLRLLGRFPRAQVGEWGTMIARNGLSHRDIEVRDAAVRALERWGGHEAFEALKARVDVEPMPWLATYIRQVIKDLED